MVSLLEMELYPGATMAPPAMERLSFGTMSCSSNFICIPKPVQVGHAPLGLLKEKSLGSISMRSMPQSGQEKFWLNTNSSSP